MLTPKWYAYTLLNAGKKPELRAIKEAKDKGYMHQDVRFLEGSFEYYDVFESVMSGRDMHDSNQQLSNKFRMLFKA